MVMEALPSIDVPNAARIAPVAMCAQEHLPRGEFATQEGVGSLESAGQDVGVIRVEDGVMTINGTCRACLACYYTDNSTGRTIYARPHRPAESCDTD